MELCVQQALVYNGMAGSNDKHSLVFFALNIIPIGQMNKDFFQLTNKYDIKCEEGQ